VGIVGEAAAGALAVPLLAAWVAVAAGIMVAIEGTVLSGKRVAVAVESEAVVPRGRAVGVFVGAESKVTLRISSSISLLSFSTSTSL
jgi:hypothetical protein